MRRSDFDILCIGSLLWDVVGRSRAIMLAGADVPGRIIRLPGGVAMNIAMTLSRFGLRPALLSHVGRDAEGDELIAAAHSLGIVTEYIHRSDSLVTDIYMAIEDANGLIAAIADAHSLEAAGNAILTPLANGRLGKASDPYEGLIALDGNLTRELLEDIAQDPLFARADLRIAPASPGKADRLMPFLTHHRAVLYVNLEEAGLLCRRPFTSARDAAQGLVACGATRVLVTDGAQPAAEANANGVFTRTPPPVTLARVTGAGDTFMAAHIAAEREGAVGEQALERALAVAAAFVAGDTGK